MLFSGFSVRTVLQRNFVLLIRPPHFITLCSIRSCTTSRLDPPPWLFFTAM